MPKRIRKPFRHLLHGGGVMARSRLARQLADNADTNYLQIDPNSLDPQLSILFHAAEFGTFPHLLIGHLPRSQLHLQDLINVS
ncbi:hypothetical protein [Ancylobacter defluvii]|uniref:hypothetical protein n=1 Tax=Ancylobacter defluvii TaxID=1282440 RepID=UPI001BCBEC80|nr:hypothetical protein [Ancylobacter defluvii]MBS7589938.1 hypothetical protein [Ancylobacter defluvii]